VIALGRSNWLFAGSLRAEIQDYHDPRLHRGKIYKRRKRIWRRDDSSLSAPFSYCHGNAGCLRSAPSLFNGVMEGAITRCCEHNARHRGRRPALFLADKHVNHMPTRTSMAQDDFHNWPLLG
jgi:hypothetical protein